MKNILFLLFVFCIGSGVPASANESGDNHVSQTIEYLLASKRQAIVRTVQFAPGEEEKFWPLYDEYVEEMGPVLQQLATLLSRYQSKIDSVSEQEANEIIDSMLAANTKSIDIQQDYLSKVRKILPAEKVLHISYVILTPSL